MNRKKLIKWEIGEKNQWQIYEALKKHGTDSEYKIMEKADKKRSYINIITMLL